MIDREDNRTMADLAREVLQVQDACNLSGVVLSFGRSIIRLRVLLGEQGNEGTSNINHHPICQAWASKIADLSGSEEAWAKGLLGKLEALANG
jgi:hypothetical protein